MESNQPYGDEVLKMKNTKMVLDALNGGIIRNKHWTEIYGRSYESAVRYIEKRFKPSTLRDANIKKIVEKWLSEGLNNRVPTKQSGAD